MAFSKIESEILITLAGHRSPEGVSPDSPPLNPKGFRNIFFGKTQRRIADEDAAFLSQNGFDIHWLQQRPTPRAVIGRRAQRAELEWGNNSDLRFFRAVHDDVFGYRLHVFDLATNIALGATGRREPRDVLDLLRIHEHQIKLGAVIWAAAAKDRGRLPAYVLSQLRFTTQHDSDDYVHFASITRAEAIDTLQRWNDALAEADAFVKAMPRGKEGLGFLKDGKLVQPDPGNLDDYVEHAARRRVHWPSSPEIYSAMARSEARYNSRKG
jgi:hypothetical protein